MTDFLFAWLQGTWSLLVESAPYFLVGLFLAGLIWLFVNQRTLQRYVSDRSIKGVLRAAIVGLPLPLCSCSVLPVAAGLRNNGAGKGPTVAFLIATPESGVDSILLTYSLTDPLLTVARPVTAFIAATAAGITETIIGESNPGPKMETIPACDNPGCTDSCANPPNENRPAGWRNLVAAVRYAYGELLEDLAPYLVLGFLLAGIVSALLGERFAELPAVVASGWIGYAGAVVIGVPLYICASSSTPLAAALLQAGFSPGAILVFLLVGPATNVASLVVLKKIIGLAATARYLVAIIVVAILGGIAADWLYNVLDFRPDYGTAGDANGDRLFSFLSAVALTALILFHAVRSLVRRIKV
jgi:uncharacterized membrane protein YraQ (UPF0718 family)